MTTYPVTTVIASDGMSDLIFTTSAFNDTDEDCCADISGAQGAVELIVDMSEAKYKIDVVIKGGDGPTAGKGRKFTVPPKTCKCITVSTGETIRSDGKLYFSMSSEGTFLMNLKPRIAVVKHRNVEMH